MDQRSLRRRGERRTGFLTKAFWTGVWALALSGCAASYPDALINANGNQIRLEAITAVLGDQDLTEEERRQALRDLGIADDELIDALLRGSATLAPPPT